MKSFNSIDRFEITSPHHGNLWIKYDDVVRAQAKFFFKPRKNTLTGERMWFRKGVTFITIQWAEFPESGRWFYSVVPVVFTSEQVLHLVMKHIGVE